MNRAAKVAVLGSIFLLAPFAVSAAIIAEQPVFSEVEHITGDVPLIFSGASGRTPSLMSLFSATGTVRTAKIHYSMPSWPNSNGMQMYLWECPLHVGDTLTQCHHIIARDAALGWDGVLVHPPVANNGELTVDFTSAITSDETPIEYTDGVPLNSARGYRLEAVFSPNTFTADIAGTFGTTSAGGFYPYFKLEGNGPLQATTTPDKPDPVIIVPGILGSMEHNGVWEIDPILHGYDDLIATLDANGYTPDIDLFTFPYDWHSSNIDTAVLLKGRIDQVKAICGCTKVDLVAHSMGGLVARQYIQSASYQHDVDQIIFLGTPHLGAPKAYLMWEGGDFGPGSESIVLRQLMKQEAKENGYSDVFSYMRGRPISSIMQLLPISDYLFDNTQVRQYPTNYPNNQFLEDLKNGLPQLASSGVRISNVVGSTPASETISGLTVVSSTDAEMWEHGKPTEKLMGSGDGTVPLSSANLLGVDSIQKTAPHLALPAAAEGDIVNLLTNKRAETIVNNWDVPNIKFLLVKIFSPADLLVISPTGQRIGRSEVGSEINEISGAFYSGYTTDSEFIVIPNPPAGEYKIFTRGTGSGGKFTIETDYIQSATSSSIAFSGTINLDDTLEFKLKVDDSSPTANTLESTDTTPPAITIVSPKAQDYERNQSIPVSVSASDASGIQSLKSRFGTTTIPNLGTLDSFFLKLGKSSIVSVGTDNVGNVATSTIYFRVIATPDSVLADIERCYSLGWINKSVRDTLVKRMQAAIKISKIIEKRSDGKPGSEKIVKVVDKILAAAMLVELQQLKGRGMNELAFILIKEDLTWLISN